MAIFLGLTSPLSGEQGGPPVLSEFGLQPQGRRVRPLRRQQRRVRGGGVFGASADGRLGAALGPPGSCPF